MSAAKKTAVPEVSPLDGMRIDPVALRMICGRAALSIQGVVSLSDDAAAPVSVEDAAALPNAIQLHEKGRALRFTIKLVALYGVSLGALALLVQRVVREAVSAMTDLETDAVRVVFVGISFPEGSGKPARTPSAGKKRAGAVAKAAVRKKGTVRHVPSRTGRKKL